MPHVFDFEHVEILESDERKSIQPPDPLVDLILKIFPRGRRNVSCEIGPGAGHFTFSLARLFDRVYVIEVNEEMMNYLRKKTEKANITNIHFILSASPPPMAERVNLALFSDVLHELDRPEEYLEWAFENCEVVVVIDWKKKNMPLGPPVEERVSESRARSMLLNAGFSVEPNNVYPCHYMCVGRKS
ncbi:MAG: class I SAM-dependent methyltransferase [Promethearchaeota archaeon]